MRKYSYGLKDDDYKKMRQAQQDRCSICLRHESQFKGLVVDHDHATGRVRGLVCAGCNTMLGQIETNFIDLEIIRKYLFEKPINSLVK